MPGDKGALSGVTLSRTLVPTNPPGYLSRKHLFPLIANEAPGTTLVIASAGYGKSSLVAEWARSQNKKVIWMTVSEGDSLSEMSAMLIAATRNVLPGFGKWFERDQPMRPTEVVRRWGNELLQTGQEFVFVLDNLRDESASDVDIANNLIAQFPSNLHFVAIRRDAIDSIYATLSSRGTLKVVTGQDLRFSDDEVLLLAQTYGLSLDPITQSIVESAYGWPSAISLLLEHIKSRGNIDDIAHIMTSSVEPLRALALLVINNLDPKVIATVEKLSIVENFDLEMAQLILGDEYSFDLINDIALKGEILSHAPGVPSGYSFSIMIREVLNERLRKNSVLKSELHNKLITYFESRGQASLAIEHAFEAGNQEKIAELFPGAARIKQAKGRGGELLRWAQQAGQSKDEGELKALTVSVTGMLANLDFSGAQGEVERLLLGSEKSVSKEFYQQVAFGARTYIQLSDGRFTELEESVRNVLYAKSGCYLGVDDQINLLRLLAVKHYIFNEVERLGEIYDEALKLAKQTNLKTSHTFLLAIHAMKLHQEGEYRRAYEVAVTATRESQREGYVGFHGPLDSLYVTARCLLEFSRPQEAFAILEQIRNLSYQWKQWHWHFLLEDNFLQDLCLRGSTNEALERLRKSRELASSFVFPHQLGDIIDINEMYVRRHLKDFDRLEKLVNRGLNIRQTQQMKMAVDQFKGRKTVTTDAEKLPNRTPRERIWKALMDASLNIETENLAVPAMREAMRVGASVGAKETFLRQRAEMGNLIIKIANEHPTIYNEELASAMADRIRDRGTQMTEGHPALTKRELEILRQLSTGRTLTVISGELHISQNTMKTHLKNLYRKLAVEGRKEAVEKANSLFLL